jgi:hypothetical protein
MRRREFVALIGRAAASPTALSRSAETGYGNASNAGVPKGYGFATAKSVR